MHLFFLSFFKPPLKRGKGGLDGFLMRETQKGIGYFVTGNFIHSLCLSACISMCMGVSNNIAVFI